MSLIKRNILRVAKVISAVTTDVTSQADTPSSSNTALVMGTSDKLYLAFRKPFTGRYFHFSTLNTNAATLTVKYWNGSAFAAVEDLIDQTSGFTANGFISWGNLSGWQSRAAAPWADVDLYWIEITTSAVLSAGTALQAILNLFVDASLLSRHYPELVDDTRWLPPGKTDFLEQFVAASDMVVTRLIQDQEILDESEIINPNDVALAACHFAAHVIYYPVTRDDDEDKRAYKAQSKGNAEINAARITVDRNGDGVGEEAERELPRRVRLR